MFHLSTASEKGDVVGSVGLGFVHFKGIGVPVNVTRSLELLYKFLPVHSDAGYFIGEIHMGVGSARGIGRKAPHYNIPSAIQAYNVASHMGNTLAMHKLGHMLQRGMGMGAQKTCNAAANNFKTVAEKGHWVKALNRAGVLYREGRKHQALFEYSQLAAVGVESAQYNAAFILSQTSHPYCPVFTQFTSVNVDSLNRSVKRDHRVEYTIQQKQISTDLNENEIQLFVEEDIIRNIENKTDKKFQNVSNKVAFLNPNKMQDTFSSNLSPQEKCEERALLLFALSASQQNVLFSYFIKFILLNLFISG
jgi:TPR repeat protein